MSLISSWAEIYLSKDNTYENHVNKFVSYIKLIGKDSKPLEINLEDVVSCIGYYNNKGKINSIGSMESHLESLKALYKFFLHEGWTTDIFGQLPNYATFKNEIIKKYDLKIASERPYFDYKIIKEILLTLDNKIESTDISVLKGNTLKKYRHYLALRLFIKLTLLIPAKRAVIFKLTIKDFDEDYKLFKYKESNIILPNGLSRNIKDSINIISKFDSKKIDETSNLYQFLTNQKCTANDLNSWFYKFLKEFDIVEVPPNQNTYSVETIRNSALNEMVINKVELNLISLLSGTSISSLLKYYRTLDVIDEDIRTELQFGISRTQYFNYI